MADDARSATTELTVLRRWGPALLIAASVVIWAVRVESKVSITDKLEDRIVNLEGQVNDLRTDMTKFQGTVDTLKVMIESVKDGVNRIERSLEDLRKDKEKRDNR